MNKIFKGLIRFLIEVIVMTVLIVGINIFTNGMYPVSYTHLDVYKRQGESNSISNQKRILESYAKQNGFTNLQWYTDDGYSVLFCIRCV